MTAFFELEAHPALYATNQILKAQALICRGLSRMAPASASQLTFGKGQSVQSAAAYCPLGPNQARFLTIFPASSMDEGICSELITASLDDEIVATYEALSYTWESEMLTHRISVNDGPLNITENLFEAIRHLRHKKTKRTIWIDAVCINQRDMAERSQQVLYMGKIFSTVHWVVIWLGKEENSDVPILAGGAVRLKTTQEPAVAARLFESNWWYRSWTVQEFLNAQNPVFVCGSMILDWDNIRDLLEGHCRGKTYDHIYNFVRSKNSHKHDSSTLQTLMIDFGHSGATDPRDKVYALLDIAKDGSSIVPDYTATVRRVYTDVVKMHIENDRNIDIICTHHRGYNSIELPSWVPDWSVSRASSQNWTVESTGCSPYRAGFLKEHGKQLELDSDIPVVMESRALHVLKVAGVSIGLISESTNSLDPALFGKDDWFQEFRAWIPEDIEAGLYLNGESNFRAFCRTVIADMFGIARLNIMGSASSRTFDHFRLIFSDPMNLKIPTQIFTSLRKATYRTRFARLSSGHMALVPEASRKGDAIVVLNGSSTPIGLRPFPSPFKPSANSAAYEVYQMIGPCYVHGVMDREMAEKILLPFMIT
jgi:hypothetical protein